jgi:hypothetical protein
MIALEKCDRCTPGRFRATGPPARVVSPIGTRGCSHILGQPVVAPPDGPKLQAVAACLNAGDLMSIEFGIARK